MTPLGKMLSIFVFLLALVWAWLTVNTFVSRTNWKAEADKYQKAAAATAEAHEKLRQQVEAERAAAKAEIEALRRDRDSAIVRENAYREDNKSLKVDIDAKLADAAKLNPAQNEANARQKELQGEIVNLTASNKTFQEKEVKQTKDTADARLAKESAERDAAAEKQRAATLEAQIRTKDDKLQEALARAKNPAGEGVAVRPTPPEGFRGTVREVGTTGEFVVITPGGNTGLRAGTRLKVKRLDPKAPKFVGFLTVSDDINPDRATCQFEPPRRGNKPLSADDYPKPGDVVEPDTK